MAEREIVRIFANYSGASSEETFLLSVDKTRFESLSEADRRAALESQLKNVALSKQFGITFVIPAYSYAEDVSDLLARHDYGNTLVEVTLPYCLHLPNNHDLVIKLSDDRSVRIILQKIWTERATNSDATDFFHSDKVTYFQKSEWVTPEVPVDPKSGWEMRFTGKNIEKERDANGTFRYTRASIEFDTSIVADRTDPKEVFSQVSAIALDAVNRLLDVYRYVTGADYIERLSALNVINVFFLKQNMGFYPIGSPTGIGSAIMNRSHHEIERMESMLESGERPPLFELLRLSAKASYSNGSLTLAIVQSFQALEISLERFIFTAYLARGMAEGDIEGLLDAKWRTKDRLRDVVRELTGKSANKEAFWDRWCTAYDKIRNEVIHGGRDATVQEATAVMKANDEVMDWVRNLPPTPPPASS